MDCVRANISVSCRKQTVGSTNSDAAVGTKEEGDHLRGVDHMAKGKKRVERNIVLSFGEPLAERGGLWLLELTKLSIC